MRRRLHAEVAGGGNLARAAGDAATNVGHVSADEALEATARRLAAATGVTAARA